MKRQKRGTHFLSKKSKHKHEDRMFEPPDHYHNVSLRLSEVLDDIGVNQRLVMERKRDWLLFEGFQNVSFKLDGHKIQKFNFGSQTEGSTTQGLSSDVNELFVTYNFRVIPDLSKWEPFPGSQFLMLQDHTTAPGYCLLQLVSSDVRLPVQDIQSGDYTTDYRERTLLKHSAVLLPISGETVRNGPANSQLFGNTWMNYLLTLYCPSWPREADPWLLKQNSSDWPTADMKRYAARSGCFLVPVASRCSKHGDTEWRISTSLAERCLMFSLNLTQLRCYILMKMIIKSLLHPEFEDVVTSFICKTILFHCIADSVDRSLWCDHKLLKCLNTCLQRLFHNIRTENCPHFIIPGNNLLRGKLLPDIKQRLAEKMCSLTGDIVRALTDVSIDDLGIRLGIKLGQSSYRQLPSRDDIYKEVVLRNQKLIFAKLSQNINGVLTKLLKPGLAAVHEKLFQIMLKLYEIGSIGSVFESGVYALLIPFLYTTLGTLLASNDIAQGRDMSPVSISWFSAGLNSDVASSRLKLASAMYCTGDFGRCEIILNNLETRLNSPDLYFVCFCNRVFSGAEFIDKGEEKVIRENTAFCVKYLPSETCIPRELRYELFRSTGDDVQYRAEDADWMDFAVVDSLPYLYFLQYKVYSQLHKSADQRRALDNLTRTIHIRPKLGHKETALNLIGQLYVEENRIQDAMGCYTMSLKLRYRNNAAKWHICILLAQQVMQLSGTPVDC